MKKNIWVTVIFSALTMGSIAPAQSQDISFRKITDMQSFEKSLLRTEIENGQYKPNNSLSFRDINIDGINSAYGDQNDLNLFVMLVIKDVCPTCATTSSGSTVRVSYGNSSSNGKDTYVLNSDDYELTYRIEKNCEELLDSHKRRRGGKDILIVDDNDDDDKIALCFDRK